MPQVLRVRRRGVCATKDPLRESLIDGSKMAQPIIKILERQPCLKNTIDPLPPSRLRLGRRIEFGMNRLKKQQNAIRGEGERISSCMVRYSPEKTQQVWSTHTPGVSHHWQGTKDETKAGISVLSPLACFHVLDTVGKKFWAHGYES
jgi:hypothetical protein